MLVPVQSEARLVVRCELAVFSDAVEPDAITERIGIQPSVTRRRGDLIRTGGPQVPNHQWVWHPDSGVEQDMDSQLDALRAVTISRVDSFRKLQGEADVVLAIVIEHHGDDLSLGWVLDRRHVALAAALGASIDVDEYDYTSS
jgi:hypothetical protein